jgi:hypothetical protein
MAQCPFFPPDPEQPFASRDEDRDVHGQPPDKAWKTWIVLGWGDEIGQPQAIADGSTIDEDRHVPAQCRLVIEHVEIAPADWP